MHHLLLIAALAAEAAAFFPYLPPGHPGAQRVPNVADAISKGFAYTGNEQPLRSEDKLSKIPLRKRSLAKRGHLEKRLNQFKVDMSDTPTAQHSAAIDQDGTDFSYFAEVAIGSNSLYMLLDTGSSAMWVMGQGCTSSACQTHQLSSSSSGSGQSFSLSYATGSVSGDLGSDTLGLAGMSLDVTLGLATQTSDQFDSYPMDGILGLARSANGTDFNADTFIQVVQNAHALPANVFGVWLDRAGGANDGEINFGAPDTSRFSGSLNFMPTNSDLSRWEIPADDVLVNGQSTGLSGRTAVIDTGTTYMFVPPSDADAIFKNVPGASLPSGSDMYHLPCDTTTNISVVFNNVAYSVSPQDYVGPSVGGGTCYTHIIGLAAVDSSSSTWLLGDTFLKNVYTLFDADEGRVGFGQPTAQSTSSSSSSGGASPKQPEAAAASQPPPTQGGVSPTAAHGSQASKAGGSGNNNNNNGDAMGSIGNAASSLGRGQKGLCAGVGAAVLALALAL